MSKTGSRNLAHDHQWGMTLTNGSNPIDQRHSKAYPRTINPARLTREI